MPTSILVVEDDELLLEFIQRGLSHAGFNLLTHAGGESALSDPHLTDCEALILDRTLPGMNGISLLRALRARGVAAPAMFLTARASLGEKVEGLNAGADDYLAKPFETDELVARVRALVRRPRSLAPELLCAGPLQINLRARTAAIAGRTIALTHQDIELLSIFLRFPERAFSRDSLLQRLGSSDLASPAAVDHAISRLRRKLADEGAPAMIETVRGLGYRLHHSAST